MRLHRGQFASALKLHSVIGDPFEQIIERYGTRNSRHDGGNVLDDAAGFLERHNIPRATGHNSALNEMGCAVGTHAVEYGCHAPRKDYVNLKVRLQKARVRRV